MRKVNIDYLNEGSKLAKPVYIDSINLLSDGTMLSPQYIQKLKQLGFPSVFINDGFIDDVPSDDLISERTRINTIKCLKKVFLEYSQNETIDVAVLKDMVFQLTDEIKESLKFGLSINDIYLLNDYFLHHSLNVCLISIFVGLSLNWEKKKLFNLGLGALLHDIGKIKVPLEILNKPGKLTNEEYEIVKKHANYGYEILSLNTNLDVSLPFMALFHHERLDGSGYPRGLKNDTISDYASIVALADVYDAMSSDRCFTKGKPIYEIYQYFTENSGKLFDPVITDEFIKNIAIYPNGTLVMLSDGRSGFVIKQNSYSAKNPVVRIFWDCDGTQLSEPVEINLSHEVDSKILQVISGQLQGIIREN